MKLIHKLLSAAVAVGCVLSLAACTGEPAASTDPQDDLFKVGLMTPTLSFSEDQYRAGEEMAQKYPDIVKHITLPDDFAAEQETGITQIMNLATDPEVKAIVIAYGDSGILPAIEKAKKANPDLVVVTAPIWDDPDLMKDVIDLCIDCDWNRRGEYIAQKAKDMGAETLIHYSFPTHTAMEEIAQRRDVMKAKAKSLGMEFVEVNMPDPYVSGDNATNQFIREDIPKQIEKYGPDTCIFSTYCPTQDIIVNLALVYKYIMAEQCCPTPTQGFPAGMNLEISPEDAGNFDKINEMIRQKAAEAGVTGRLSTWPVPMTVFQPKFATEAVIRSLKGEMELTDFEALNALAEEVAGVPVHLSKLADDVDNYILFIMDSIIY